MVGGTGSGVLWWNGHLRPFPTFFSLPEPILTFLLFTWQRGNIECPSFFLAHSLQGMLKPFPPIHPWAVPLEGSRKNTTLFFISKLSSVEDFWTWVTKCAETLRDLSLNDRVLSWPLEVFCMIISDFVAFGSCFEGNPFLNPQWPAKWVELK